MHDVLTCDRETFFDTPKWLINKINNKCGVAKISESRITYCVNSNYWPSTNVNRKLSKIPSTKWVWINQDQFITIKS